MDLVNFSVEGWDKKSFAYYKQGCDFDKVTTNIKNFNIFLQNENTNRPPVTNIQVMVNKDTELNSFLKVWGPLVNEIVYSSCHNAIKIDENMKISHLKFDDYLEKNIYDFEYNEGFKYCGYPFTDIVISSDGAPIMCCSDFNYTTKTSSLISTSLKDFLDSKERKLRQKQFITQQLDICSNCSSFYDLTEESKIEYNKKLKTT